MGGLPSVEPGQARVGDDSWAGRRIHIRGTVQGVGFRPWVYRTAVTAGVTGAVWNDSSGVYVEAFGRPQALTRFVSGLRLSPPPAARVASLEVDDIAPQWPTEFRIIESARSTERSVSIPPDLATCDDCLAEIGDPANRRYRYAFTNCTNCGPRFTIATDIPYDRKATTMAPFAMCDACRREYEDVTDRRFHAQPNACPVCGPRLTLQRGTEVVAVADPIATAAEGLRAGLIVAVKGLGGFHLVCDATNPDAVARLRQRKHRDEKPLAVMVSDASAAEALAVLNAGERQLLTGVERPIVLVSKRDVPLRGPALAAGIAPRNRMLGLFLPYTPLHHLLLGDAGCPLVMTSANLSEEPIAYRNDEAVCRLSAIADLFLMHDREIQTRCDDSVAAVVAGAPTVLRRSRGFVPRSVPLTTPVTRPVLACGALLKNAFCIADGNRAWLGPHIGDLENLETYDSYVEAIARFERFVEVAPVIIAFDQHPDYLSTRYARGRREATKVAVQHHHAHVVSVMAEHGLEGPVIGVAYDGTGYGLDGTMWGGEVLVADRSTFARVATVRPLALAGGDRAIREPWRLAVALLLDAFDEVPRRLVQRWPALDTPDRPVIETLIRRRVQAPLSHGMGRYFDAFGALFLHRDHASFEGQVALEWNQVADGATGRVYPFRIDRDCDPWQLDLRPMTRAAVHDALHGAPACLIAAAFHNTLAVATGALVRAVAEQYGPLPVVAGGGCFQNARLAEGLRAALVPMNVRFASQVPPGDGGIALGQAVVAAALAEQSALAH